MENITIGQISAIILFLGTFIGGLAILLNYTKKGLKSMFKEDFAGIKKNLKEEIDGVKLEIQNLKENINEIGISDCKNFLISCYAKLESNQELDETERERYYELYDLYTNKYHKNSYIHAKHEKLKKEGKL